MKVWTTAGAVAMAAALAGASLVATGPPSGAAEEWPIPTGVTGDFVGDRREEVFSYTRGAEPDRLVRFSRASGPGSPVSMAVTSFTVGGTYTPLAGDYDGDGHDEIFWYAPGAATDYLWDFTSTTTVRSRALQVTGAYRPVTGDFTGDGVDDVLWYAPGAAADHLWDYAAGGGHRDIPLSVAGDYQPLAGSFGTDATDDVLWMRAGSTYLWDFDTAGGYRSRPRDLDSGTPYVLDIFDDGWGGDDIYWTVDLSTDDHVEDFVDGSSLLLPQPVGDGYLATTGDFLGDGHDDVIWGSHFDALRLWDYAPRAEPDSVKKWSYGFPTGVWAAATSGPGADAGVIDQLPH